MIRRELCDVILNHLQQKKAIQRTTALKSNDLFKLLLEYLETDRIFFKLLLEYFNMTLPLFGSSVYYDHLLCHHV